MPAIQNVVNALKQEEQRLEETLSKVRRAIAELNGSDRRAARTTTTTGPAKKRTKKQVENKRGMTAAQKKAVSRRMKAYWAAKRKEARA